MAFQTNGMETADDRPLIRSRGLWLLMLASLAISLPLAYLLNIRFDEAFTLQTTSNGPVDAFAHAIGFGQQAPLYFVLVGLWRSIDPSIFFARIFSVLWFPLFVWVAAEVSKRYLKDVNPLIVAAIILVHQQVVWNALDIRLYSMMTLLAGLLLLLFYDGYLSEKAKARSRVLFTIVAVVSIYTQYYLGFQLVGGAVALLVLGRWKTLSKYVLDMAVAGICFIPMLVVLFGGQLSHVTAQSDVHLPITELIKQLYQPVVSLMMPFDLIGSDAVRPWLVRIVIGGVAILFAAKLFRERKSEDAALAAVTAVVVAFSLAALYFVGFTLMQPRHLSALILPLTIIPIAALRVSNRKPLIYGWVALIIALNGIFLFAQYRPLAKPGDFERVAKYLMANEQAGEPFLVFHADAVLPLRYYYQGKNDLLALPQENGTDAWNPRNNILKDEAQILTVIGAHPSASGRLWLVHDGWCAHGSIKFNCGTLENVVDKYFVVERTEKFYEPVTVRLLRRK
ncbi:MAG: hypothetical protein WBO10_11310 [Pyrinomonadaceae bacterium]